MEQTGSLLIRWYRKNKRDLPWRETKDPYRIWLSEIILQQTRVDQGLPYFLHFIKAYPSVHKLAEASEQKVLKSWEGLGYYSRARNLHSTAKLISKELKGKFPTNHDALLKLKGIGPYTAAAIASFCFEEPRAVVDGNVYRVLSRLFGIKTPIDSGKGKKAFQELAQQFLASHLPSEFNQAIMEFGATYCKPQSPDCGNCVLLDNCYAGLKNKAMSFPVKDKKIKIRKRQFYFFILKFGKHLLIRERVDNDIWKGLYEFPLVETKTTEKVEKVVQQFLLHRKIRSGSYSIPSPPVRKRHLLSHQELYAQCITVVLKKKPSANENEKWVSAKNLSTYPMPRLLLHFVSELH